MYRQEQQGHKSKGGTDCKGKPHKCCLRGFRAVAGHRVYGVVRLIRRELQGEGLVQSNKGFCPTIPVSNFIIPLTVLTQQVRWPGLSSIGITHLTVPWEDSDPTTPRLPKRPQ
jgi:hypothetical protein